MLPILYASGLQARRQSTGSNSNYIDYFSYYFSIIVLQFFEFFQGLFEKGEENAFIEETALAQMAVERIKILMNLPDDNVFIAHLIKNKLMDTMAAWGPAISTGKLQKISDLLKSGNKFETDLLTTDIFDLKVKLLLEIL